MHRTTALGYFLVFVVLGVYTNNVYADQSDITTKRATDIVRQWIQWVEKHNISEASIAISYNGQLVAQQGAARTANSPAPVASLTKAVTGICIAKLASEGKLSFDSKLQVLAPQLNSDVSIGSLLTHTSGYRSDITQRPNSFPDLDKEHLQWIAEQEMDAGQIAPEGEGFAYNNANYAMLGNVISTITNQTYEQACNELVFRSIGIEDAALNPDWRIMSSWGGWKTSAVSYLKFIDTYFANNKVLDQNPELYPHHSFTGGANYGMGIFFRNGRNGGINFWHDGKWHTDINGIEYRFASYTAKWDNGWAVSTNHNISAINGEHTELDQVLSEAAHRP